MTGKPSLLDKPPNVWLVGALAVGIIALNVFDALATLAWINVGMEEANPFMAYILEYDTSLFVFIKTVGITAAVALIIYFARRRYAVAVYGLALIFCVYLAVFAMHVYIYTHTSLM